MSKNLIKFIPCTKAASLAGTEPQKSIKCLPDWYKEIAPFTDGDTKLRFPMSEKTHNTTVKRCVPFLDAMSIGYMAVLDDDVFVEQTEGGPLFRWKSEVNTVTFHNPNQFPNLPISSFFHHEVAKWIGEWIIETPKGYSTMFTHPSNRMDLPFFTLSGVVDTDIYDQPIQFPFVLHKGFEGIIEAGTPVCQIIPVKREPWTSQREKFNEEENYKKNRRFTRTFYSSYKKNYWQPKKYD